MLNDHLAGALFANRRRNALRDFVPEFLVITHLDESEVAPLPANEIQELHDSVARAPSRSTHFEKHVWVPASRAPVSQLLRRASQSLGSQRAIYLGSKPETSGLTAPAEPVLAHGTELLKLDGDDFVLTTTDLSNGLRLDLAEDFFAATSLESGPRDLGYELRVWGQVWCQLLSNAI